MRTLICVSVLLSALMLGCNQATSESTENVGEPTVSTENSSDSTTATETVSTTLTTFQTPSGKFVCPIMKSEIPNEDAAYGYVVHEGVKYLVCCEPCEKAGKADPAALAAKAQELK